MRYYKIQWCILEEDFWSQDIVPQQKLQIFLESIKNSGGIVINSQMIKKGGEI